MDQTFCAEHRVKLVGGKICPYCEKIKRQRAIEEGVEAPSGGDATPEQNDELEREAEEENNRMERGGHDRSAE